MATFLPHQSKACTCDTYTANTTVVFCVSTVHGDLSVSAIAKKYNSDAALSILDTLCTGLSLVECIFLTMPARLKDNCSELALWVQYVQRKNQES